MTRVRVGTQDVIGAVVTSVDYNEMTLELDGRKFVVDLEYEDDFHSMCEGDCDCCYGSSTGYLVAEEIVE